MANCNYTQKTWTIICVVGILIFVVVNLIVSSVILSDSRFVKEDVKKIIRLQITSATTASKRSFIPDDKSQDFNEGFSKKTQDYKPSIFSYDTMMEQVYDGWSTLIDIFLKTSNTETIENVEDYIGKYGDIPKESFSTFDKPLKASTGIPSFSGFVSAMESSSINYFLGSAKLVENNYESIKKNYPMSPYYQLSKTSKIFNIGRVSSCLIKHKSHETKMSVNMEEICSFDFHLKSPDSNLYLPPQGQGESIHLENYCRGYWKTRPRQMYPKKTFVYPAQSLKSEEESFGLEKTDIILVSLEFFMKNKDRYEEIIVDDVSCLDSQAPLSSDLFLFINNFSGKTQKTLSHILYNSIHFSTQKESLNKKGIISFNQNWIRDDREYYPIF